MNAYHHNNNVVLESKYRLPIVNKFLYHNHALFSQMVGLTVSFKDK